MNGKLKLVLKLPKSLQQDIRSNDSASAQPVKKRKRPQDQGVTQTIPHHSSHAAHGSQEAGAAVHPPKKSKLVVKLGSAPSGSQASADGKAQGQPSIKPRFTIKLPSKVANSDGKAQTPSPALKPSHALGPPPGGAPGPSDAQHVQRPRKGSASKKGGKRKQDGSIKSPRDGLKPALTLRLNDVHKSAPAAPAQPSISLEPSPQKAEIKVEAAPSAAPTVTAAARPEQGPGPIAGGKFASLNGRPDVSCTPAAVHRIIQRVQKKDTHGYFRDPVTDELAPGYSLVIKRPMDFKTMLARFERGHYTAWDLLQEDLETIFNNAMSYNPPATPYHKKAKILLNESQHILEKERKGVKDLRGARPAQPGPPKDPSQPAAPQQLLPEKRRGRIPKQAGRGGKLGQRPGKPIRGTGPGRPAGAHPMVGKEAKAAPQYTDQFLRAHYRGRFGQPAWQALRGLALGATAEGVPYASGRPVLCQAGGAIGGVPSGETYARSLARFAAGVCGRAREAVLSRAARLLSAPVAPAYVAPARVQLAPASAPSAAAGSLNTARNIVHSSGGVPIAAAKCIPWMATPGMLPSGTPAALPTPPASSFPAPAASTAASTAARGAFPTAAAVLGPLPSTAGRASIPGLPGLTSQPIDFNAYVAALQHQQHLKRQQQQQQQQQQVQQPQPQLPQPLVGTPAPTIPFLGGRPPSTT